MRATFQHVEIPVDDLERAADFYRRAFGWKVERLPWNGPAYCTVRGPEPPPDAGSSEKPEASGGGLMGRRDLGADHPLVMIQVEEATLAEALARIEQAGGRVEQPPEPVGDFGESARFRDSEGNLLGLWRNA